MCRGEAGEAGRDWGEMRGVYDFVSFFFNFLQKSFCKFLKKKDFISYT
jgi:hypothetical protein